MQMVSSKECSLRRLYHDGTRMCRQFSWLCSTCIVLLTFASGVSAQEKPSAPGSFEAIAASATEIRCYWLPVKSKAAGKYRVLRDGKTVVVLPVGVTAYADTNLSPDTTYRYSVQFVPESAVTGAATPGNSSSVNQTAISQTPDYIERTFAPFPPLTTPISTTPHSLATLDFDVVVVQASSGGVAAAIEAAKRGLKVALVEPTTRLGGMPVNGLSATDLRREYHASGFLVRFRDRVRNLYALEGVKSSGLQYEPRMAHQAMKSLLYETPGITIFRRTRLHKVIAHNVDRSAENAESNTIPDTFGSGQYAGDRTESKFGNGFTASGDNADAQRARRRVEAVEVKELGADGKPTGSLLTLQGKVFIDSTDSGDLAAAAGASFRLGREKRTLQEPHNGVIYYDRKDDKLLPGSTGIADKRLQSYAYLLTVKDYGAGADKSIPMPKGYRKEFYAHSPAWLDSWAVSAGRMPNDKLELNQHPEGGDRQEINYRYPTSDYAERVRVEKLYRDRVLGYLYYIQNEQGQKQIGLPDDDYRDTGGFPSLLYVREGRRILGEQLPVENDIAQDRRLIRPESIGLGDYPMDSHAVRVKTDWNSPDMGEGEWWLYQYTPWHRLPYGVIVPQCLDNVFVTTAVSSTHVSYGTYRLEPVRMAFGQAAGAASALCIRYGLAARDVPVRQLQRELLPGATNPAGDPNLMLTFLTDVQPDNPYYFAIHFLTVRGFAFTAEEFKPDAPTTRGELGNWLRLLAERAAPAPKTICRETVEPMNDVDFGAANFRSNFIENSRQEETVAVRRAYYPYMGAPIDAEAVRLVQRMPEPTKPITRAEFAHWFVRVMDWKVVDTANTPSHYTDIPDSAVRADADTLNAHGIDSLLWDSLSAMTTDSKMLYKPDAPLNHAGLFAALYLAQLSLGPLFDDNPVDARNGRETPPALYETIKTIAPAAHERH